MGKRRFGGWWRPCCRVTAQHVDGTDITGELQLRLEDGREIEVVATAADY